MANDNFFPYDGSFRDQFLVDSGLYESNDEAVKRQEVLGKLDEVMLVL